MSSATTPRRFFLSCDKKGEEVLLGKFSKHGNGFGMGFW